MFLKLFWVIACVQLCYGAAILEYSVEEMEEGNQQLIQLSSRSEYQFDCSFLFDNIISDNNVKLLHLYMMQNFTYDEVKQMALSTINKDSSEEKLIDENGLATLKANLETRFSPNQADRMIVNIRKLLAAKTVEERKEGFIAIASNACINAINKGLDLFFNQFINSDDFNVSISNTVPFPLPFEDHKVGDSSSLWTTEDTEEVRNNILKNQNIDVEYATGASHIVSRLVKSVLSKDDVILYAKLVHLCTAPKLSVGNLIKMFKSMDGISNINDRELTLVELIIQQNISSDQTEQIIESLRELRDTNSIDERKNGMRKLMRCAFLNAIGKGLELFSNSYLLETSKPKQKEHVAEDMTSELEQTVY